MYQEKLVCAVKHNGRVLREQGDTVLIPFGSEYTLHFKNLNSVRALVRVSVDGTDATKGTSLIVPPNGTVELERFLEAGQMDKGHKFKFIERTAKIEDGPRGIKAEDGLIRVEFEFERVATKIEDVYIRRNYINEYWNNRPYWNGPFYSGNLMGSTTSDVTYSSNASMSNTSSEIKTSAFRSMAKSATLSSTAGDSVTAQNASFQNASFVNQVSDVGITVPGSVSEQKFEVGAWFPTDGQKHVLILKLLGQVGEQKVEKPVTVKTKQECPTCGTQNKHGTKFCRECGTGLTVL